MIHRILFNVCERLFDERVKEWLLDSYIIVSGSFREIDGRVSLRCAGGRWNLSLMKNSYVCITKLRKECNLLEMSVG